jgi:Rrf2 family transcriptional regulator, repressor of oqxAB
MLSLALAEQEGVTRLSSSALAKGLGANPSFVRKLLFPLIESGMVSSSHGRNGGVCLGRAPADISLRDIYQAAIGEKIIWAQRQNVPHRCIVSDNIEQCFTGIVAVTEKAIAAALAERSLAEIFTELKRLDKKRRTIKHRSMRR